ncbi:MAG TPA: cytochrome c biogenesis protein CcdA [Candidatus Gastranaerophilales bacterium]|nr:cytochrome c biogenesis protein CcdA [Candidatus Gastranaerophilales bacterium]
MIQEITQKLQIVSSEPIGLLFALLLGTASAAASSCCTLPALGLVAGYSGTQNQGNRSDIIKSAVFFMIGTIVSLMIIGGISGFVGQVAQSTLGQYWKVFAGAIAIMLGLASLKLLPFNISLGNFNPSKKDLGKFGLIVTGIALGGIVAVSSLPCNPGIFIVMGAAILQGAVLWAMLLLGFYAIGFALPLGALMLGVSLGGFTLASKGMDKILRWISGAVLIVIGFYFLLSF